MRLRLASDSRVLIDLRATGVLKALAHSPTLVARPEPLEVVAEGERFTCDVEARVRASSIEPPAGIPASDSDKMRDNLLGPEVLDARRFPALVLRGRFEGSIAGGTLAGNLEVRGAPRAISMAVAIARQDARFVATGAWEQKLSDLGVPPFRALFGAIRLEDWIRLRLEARFDAVDS
jgi:hypothetical protein